MSKTFISVLLVILAVSSYTNARRMMSDEKISSKNDNGLMLVAQTCPVGQHWYQPFKTSNISKGKCTSNKDYCTEYVAATYSCSKCYLGFELKKSQSTGHHCNMSWWLIAIICVASLFIIFLIVGLVCCYCGW